MIFDFVKKQLKDQKNAAADKEEHYKAKARVYLQNITKTYKIVIFSMFLVCFC